MSVQPCSPLTLHQLIKCSQMMLLLLQVMGSNAAQLTAAVSSLINALVASKFSVDGVLGVMNRVSYARWGLEGYVIAEANCLKGGPQMLSDQ